MIELTKQDIKAIANSRFTRHYQWRLLGSLAVWATIGIVIALALPDEPSLALMIGSFSPFFAIYIAGAIWWVKSQDKAIKTLVKQCQDDPTFVYKPLSIYTL